MKKDSKISKGSVTLSIKGRPLKIDLRAPANPVKARRMLPVFRDITNSFVQFGIEGANLEGKEISCKAGCGACCRQPVPISETEAHDIADYVESLPENQQDQITQRFRDAFSQLSKADWFSRLAGLPEKAAEERRKLAMEYFRMDIPCPFLVDESCSIHKRRPLACREYLVTSPAENCSNPTLDTVNTVELPITPSRLFRWITKGDSLSGKPDYLLLVSALDFAARNNEISDRKTGEKWLSEFFGRLSKSAKKEP